MGKRQLIYAFFSGDALQIFFSENDVLKKNDPNSLIKTSKLLLIN